MPFIEELETPNPALLALQLDAARYAKVRRMDVLTFRNLSNEATTYEEFDAKVDAYESL